MDRLDVEGLLAVPAVATALVDQAVAVRVRRDLGELAALEGRQAVARRVGVGVLQDRRRGVRVGDRHGHALAVDAVADQRGLTVGRLQLRSRIAADRVGLGLAVRRRRAGRELLAVVRRAGLDAVAGSGRRARQGVGRVLQGAALVDADHAVDRARHDGRCAGRQGQRGRVGVHGLALVDVVAHRRGEGLLDLRGRPRRLDEHAARQGLADVEALRAQPGLHRRDVRGGRRERRVELRVRQPLAVVLAARIGELVGQRRGAGLVAHLQHEAEADGARRGGGSLVGGLGDPVGLRAGDCQRAGGRVCGLGHDGDG